MHSLHYIAHCIKTNWVAVRCLINFEQGISVDTQALSELNIERQTATYKIRFGLAELEHKRLVNDINNNASSLNIDGSTSKSSNQRILNILVSHFCEELQKPISNLFTSIDKNVFNAETFFNAVHEKFIYDDIPSANLVPVLSDFAAYMRGE